MLGIYMVVSAVAIEAQFGVGASLSMWVSDVE